MRITLCGCFFSGAHAGLSMARIHHWSACPPFRVCLRITSALCWLSGCSLSSHEYGVEASQILTELGSPRYMPIIRKVMKVKEMSPTQEIWTLFYKFNPVMTPRVFTVLQLAYLDESNPTERVGCVISIDAPHSRIQLLLALRSSPPRGYTD